MLWSYLADPTLGHAAFAGASRQPARKVCPVEDQRLLDRAHPLAHGQRRHLRLEGLVLTLRKVRVRALRRRDLRRHNRLSRFSGRLGHSTGREQGARAAAERVAGRHALRAGACSLGRWFLNFTCKLNLF